MPEAVAHMGKRSSRGCAMAKQDSAQDWMGWDGVLYGLNLPKLRWEIPQKVTENNRTMTLDISRSRWIGTAWPINRHCSSSRPGPKDSRGDRCSDIR